MPSASYIIEGEGVRDNKWSLAETPPVSIAAPETELVAIPPLPGQNTAPVVRILTSDTEPVFRVRRRASQPSSSPANTTPNQNQSVSQPPRPAQAAQAVQRPQPPQPSSQPTNAPSTVASAPTAPASMPGPSRRSPPKHTFRGRGLIARPSSNGASRASVATETAAQGSRPAANREANEAPRPLRPIASASVAATDEQNLALKNIVDKTKVGVRKVQGAYMPPLRANAPKIATPRADTGNVAARKVGDKDATIAAPTVASAPMVSKPVVSSTLPSAAPVVSASASGVTQPVKAKTGAPVASSSGVLASPVASAARAVVAGKSGGEKEGREKMAIAREKSVVAGRNEAVLGKGGASAESKLVNSSSTVPPGNADKVARPSTAAAASSLIVEPRVPQRASRDPKAVVEKPMVPNRPVDDGNEHASGADGKRAVMAGSAQRADGAERKLAVRADVQKRGSVTERRLAVVGELQKRPSGSSRAPPVGAEIAKGVGDGKRRLAVVGDGKRQLAVVGDGKRQLAVVGDGKRQLAVVGEGKRPSATGGDGKRPLAVGGDGKRQLAVVGDSQSPGSGASSTAFLKGFTLVLGAARLLREDKKDDLSRRSFRNFIKETLANSVRNLQALRKKGSCKPPPLPSPGKGEGSAAAAVVSPKAKPPTQTREQAQPAQRQTRVVEEAVRPIAVQETPVRKSRTVPKDEQDAAARKKERSAAEKKEREERIRKEAKVTYSMVRGVKFRILEWKRAIVSGSGSAEKMVEASEDFDVICGALISNRSNTVSFPENDTPDHVADLHETSRVLIFLSQEANLTPRLGVAAPSSRAQKKGLTMLDRLIFWVTCVAEAADDMARKHSNLSANTPLMEALRVQVKDLLHAVDDSSLIKILRTLKKVLPQKDSENDGMPFFEKRQMLQPLVLGLLKTWARLAKTLGLVDAERRPSTPTQAARTDPSDEVMRVQQISAVGRDAGSAGPSGRDVGSAGPSGRDVGSAGSSRRDAGPAGSSGRDVGPARSSGRDAGSAGSAGRDSGVEGPVGSGNGRDTAPTASRDAGKAPLPGIPIPRRTQNFGSPFQPPRSPKARPSSSQARPAAKPGVDNDNAKVVKRLLSKGSAENENEGEGRNSGARKRQRSEMESSGISAAGTDDVVVVDEEKKRPSKKRVTFAPNLVSGASEPTINGDDLSCLFYDGYDILGCENKIQEPAVKDRASQLSRGAVFGLFGFLRTEVNAWKMRAEGQTPTLPEWVEIPYTTPSLRQVGRILKNGSAKT